ncbi:MAG: stage II sporulation protein R [Clostridium sp.]|nr:stage II sporulation protein R [Clostridium sp.]
MKKILMFLLIVFIFIGFMSNYNSSNENSENNNLQVSVASKIIRFHVLANSDSTEDQKLKLKVRDNVLKFIAPKMANSKNINESRELLKKYNNNIQEIASNVVRQNGYKYNVITELGTDEFPVKSYGDIVLPQGKYEAYRILIGSAKGHNWWCVMFPPLCFTDITKGNVEIDKTKDEMKKVLTKNEYDMVDGSNKQNDKIVVKFKIVETVKNIINNIEKR